MKRNILPTIKQLFQAKEEMTFETNSELTILIDPVCFRINEINGHS